MSGEIPDIQKCKSLTINGLYSQGFKPWGNG
jgi:hypothetical protein